MNLSPGNWIQLLGSTTTSCRCSFSFTLPSLPASPFPFTWTPKQCANRLSLGTPQAFQFNLSKSRYHFSGSTNSPSDPLSTCQWQSGPGSLKKALTPAGADPALARTWPWVPPLPHLRVSNLVHWDAEAPGYLGFYFPFAHCSHSFPNTWKLHLCNASCIAPRSLILSQF